MVVVCFCVMTVCGRKWYVGNGKGEERGPSIYTLAWSGKSTSAYNFRPVTLVSPILRGRSRSNVIMSSSRFDYVTSSSRSPDNTLARMRVRLVTSKVTTTNRSAVSRFNAVVFAPVYRRVRLLVSRQVTSPCGHNNRIRNHPSFPTAASFTIVSLRGSSLAVSSVLGRPIPSRPVISVIPLPITAFATPHCM